MTPVVPSNKFVSSGLIASALLLTIALRGCGQRADSSQEADPTPEPVTVRVLSSDTSVNHSVFWFGASKGFYQNYGLNVELDNLPPNGAALLVAGQTDSITTGTGTQSAAIKGQPIRMVLVTVGKPNFGVYGDPDIDTVEALEGKTIWGDNDLLRAILKNHNLEPDQDVTIVQSQAGTVAAIAAVKEGTADAFFGWPPTGAMARREGLEQVFFAADEIPEVPVSGIGTSLTMISERPDVVKNFLAGTLDTMDFMKDPGNKEGLIAYYMERWQFDRDLAEESYSVLLETQTNDGQITESAQRENVKLVAQAGDITELVPIEQVWDFALLKEVLATRTN